MGIIKEVSELRTITEALPVTSGDGYTNDPWVSTHFVKLYYSYNKRSGDTFLYAHLYPVAFGYGSGMDMLIFKKEEMERYGNDIALKYHTADEDSIWTRCRWEFKGYWNSKHGRSVVCYSQSVVFP